MKRIASWVCSDGTNKKQRCKPHFRIAVHCARGTIRTYDENGRDVECFSYRYGFGTDIALGEDEEFFIVDHLGKRIDAMRADEKDVLTRHFILDGEPVSSYYDAIRKRLIVTLAEQGKVCFLWPSGQPPVYVKCLKYPQYACVDRENRLIVASRHKLQVLDEDGKELYRFGGDGPGPDMYSWICGLGVNRNNQTVVCDRSRQKVDLYGEDFQLQKSLKTQFLPTAMAVDRNSNKIYISITDENRIAVLDSATGDTLATFGAPSPQGLCLVSEKRWAQWNPRERPSQISTASFVKAWYASVQRNQDPLALLPRDVAIHEIAQFISNQ